MKTLVLFLASLAFAGAAAADDASVRMGGHVNITEAVDGPLHALAGHITVDAPIAGDASLAGGHVTVNDKVDGNLRAAAGNVAINATVAGDVSVAAGRVDLGTEARIGGKLSFHGGELRQDPAAQVTGPIERSATRTRHHSEFGPRISWGGGWLWTAGLVLLAALLAAALPGPSHRMALELRERPWLTTLVGFLALTAIPVAAVLVMVTIIGIPLGLLALVLYAALLLVGYVWIAVVVGGLLLDRAKPETAAQTAWRVGAAMLAMLVIASLAKVPFLGGFIAFAALVAGVGMIVAVVMRRGEPAAPAVAA